MKILQNETTTTTTAAPNSITTDKEKLLQQQQHQQFVVEKRKAKTLKNKILQNVAQQLQQQQQQQQQQHSQQLPSASESTTASTIAMTDELTPLTAPDYNTHSGQLDTSTASSADIKTKDLAKDLTNTKSCSSNNNSSDLIIAEAAKILLKNGLNGTNAAAAAAVATATATLLTAAANFQLPQQQQNSSQLSLTTTSSALSSSSSSSLKSVASESTAVAANATTAAAAAHAQLVAIAAAAAAVNATNHKRLTALNAPNSSPSSTLTNTNLNSSKSCPSNHQLNNGTPTSTPSSTDSISPSSAHFAKPLKTNSLSSSSGSSTTTKSTPTTTMSSTSAMDMGVIDYTINSHNSLSAANNNANISLSTTSPPSSVINLSTSNINNNHKFINSTNNNNHSHHLNRSDIGRTPISSHSLTNNHNHSNAVGAGGFGGRLQFFKDGKFILELARSKDGEKGGWVSVPRKVFRTPSAATSSTVTPSATASTSAAVIPSPLTASSPVASIGGNGGGVSYPKNECSNSLSFSDDNSSLQSSPWQRDHCWKPAAPRKNVSMEMTLFYHKPACRKLTAKALLLAQRKRRKPYDMKTLENNKLFWFKKTTKQQVVVDNTQTEIQVATKVEECNNDGDKKTKDMEEKVKGVKQQKSKEDAMKISDATNGGAKEECSQFEDDKLEMLKEEHNDAEMNKLSPLKKEDLDTDVLEEDRLNKDEEKMNTSDCDVEAPNKSPPLNGNVSNEDSHNLRVLGTTSTVCNKLQGDEEQRLKKPETIKTRAKLTTIVQKLMDASVSRLAATAHHSFKTSTNSRQQSPSAANTSFASTTSSPASCSGGAKNQNSKVSPPSSTAASRLVEYHQQHVSPRKRILRELEKVSLEDNVTAAGGKRSRAKGNNIPSTTQHGGMPHSQALTSPMNKLATGGGGFNVHSSNSGNQSKITAPITTTAPPTKLYSSYSIHSLLGGTSNSGSVSPSSSSLKKVVDLPATITSSSLPYSPYHSSSIAHHQSPKSPEGNTTPGGGGKSPSNSASKIKRSPPYSSPLRDAHSRSPTINATPSGNSGSFDYGRRSPRITAEGYNKMKYSGASENTGSPHHYNHATQNYYAQYMASPHYVPSLGSSSALSPSTSSSGGASNTNSTNSSRSPRHHSSAFRATTPTSSTMAAIGVTSNANQNIPSTQRGDMSPQRSATASPREATPRTVPKKTASIRRQFASPTSINTTTTITNNNNSSSPSPSMIVDNRNEDNDRRTPVSHHQQQHSLLQRSSPGSANIQNSPLHPYSYMYASATNNQHPSNATHPASPTSANVSAAAAAAAAAASYIPAVVGSPYYHPYISTLAAMRHPQMWMQHYQSAAAAAANPALLQASRHPTMLSAAAAGAAAARLSPPYHGYQYNGVSNAVALAAAAAAAGFGSATSATSSHHSNVLSSGNTLAPPGSIFNPMVHGLVAPHPATINASSGLVPATASAALGSSAHPMTDTINTDFSKASRNNYSSSSSSSSLASSSPLPGTGVSGGVSVSTSGSSGNTMYPISNKDEQSSDVPLNLSKH